jgi:hypothetical protein
MVLARTAVWVDGLGDRINQRLAVHGFEEVPGAAGSLSLLANPRCVMRGDKDDRGRRAELVQPLLQFQARHAAELNVQHQAVRLQERPRGEESFGRGIRADFESRRAEQPFERACKTLIIIHDRDIDFIFTHLDQTRSSKSVARICRRDEAAYCP